MAPSAFFVLFLITTLGLEWKEKSPTEMMVLSSSTSVVISRFDPLQLPIPDHSFSVANGWITGVSVVVDVTIACFSDCPTILSDSRSPSDC